MDLCVSSCVRHAPTLPSPAAEVPAEVVWVAPGATARSLGHGGPWGQLVIAVQFSYLMQLKVSHTSLLKSRQTVQRQAGKVYLGQPQTSQVQSERA